MGALRIGCAELRESVVQGEDIQIGFKRDGDDFVERFMGRSAAALLCQTVTCVLYQDATHDLRRRAEEVCASAPLHAVLIHEAEVSLMYQGRTVQCERVTFIPQRMLSHMFQFTVHQRHEFLECFLVPGGPTV